MFLLDFCSLYSAINAMHSLAAAFQCRTVAKVRCFCVLKIKIGVDIV